MEPWSADYRQKLNLNTKKYLLRIFTGYTTIVIVTGKPTIL